jgi:hypothetical protein
MAQFRAKSDGWLHDSYINKGEVFEYGGKPGKWMEPIGAPVPSAADKEGPRYADLLDEAKSLGIQTHPRPSREALEAAIAVKKEELGQQ